jgi:hypothetical protein
MLLQQFRDIADPHQTGPSMIRAVDTENQQVLFGRKGRDLRTIEIEYLSVID